MSFQPKTDAWVLGECFFCDSWGWGDLNETVGGANQLSYKALGDLFESSILLLIIVTIFFFKFYGACTSLTEIIVLGMR